MRAIVVIGSPYQMKLDETGNLVQMRRSLSPTRLELRSAACGNPEMIHRNVHDRML